MGLCVCKDKRSTSTVGDDDNVGYGEAERGASTDGSVRRNAPDTSVVLPLTLDNFGPHDEVLFGRPSHLLSGGRSSTCNHHFIVTRSTIDRLVLETLAVIRTLVDK
jgi:hypothetical protein